MKALLVKDIKLFFANGRQVGFMLLIPLAVGVINFGNGTMPAMLLSTLLLALFLNLFSYDEKASWTRYAFTLPVSRRAIVLVRYLIFGGLLLLSALLYTVVAAANTAAGGVSTAGEIAANGTLCIAPYMFTYCICIPLIYRYGVEKSRLLTSAAFMVPFVLIVFLLVFFEVDILAFNALRYLPLIAAGMLAAWALSLLVSMRVVNKTDW